MHSYGWEESVFPSEWVEEFNTYLNGITVMSSQVKKILIDNGVKIPITVTGLGLDHLKNIVLTQHGGNLAYVHERLGFQRLNK